MAQQPMAFNDLQKDLALLPAADQQVLIRGYLRQQHGIDPDLPDAALSQSQRAIKAHVMGQAAPANEPQPIDTGSVGEDMLQGGMNALARPTGLMGLANDGVRSLTSMAGIQPWTPMPEMQPQSKAAEAGSIAGSTLGMAGDVPFMAGTAAGGPVAGMAASGGINSLVDQMRAGKSFAESAPQAAGQALIQGAVGGAGVVAGKVAGAVMNKATNPLFRGAAESALAGAPVVSRAAEFGAGLNRSAQVAGEAAGFTGGNQATDLADGKPVREFGADFAKNAGMSLVGMAAHAAKDATVSTVKERIKREAAGSQAQAAQAQINEMQKSMGIGPDPATGETTVGAAGTATPEMLQAKLAEVNQALADTSNMTADQVTELTGARDAIASVLQQHAEAQQSAVNQQQAIVEHQQMGEAAPAPEPLHTEAAPEAPIAGAQPIPAFDPKVPGHEGATPQPLALFDSKLPGHEGAAPEVPIEAPKPEVAPYPVAPPPEVTVKVESAPAPDSIAPGPEPTVSKKAAEYDSPDRPIRVRQNLKRGTIEVEFNDDHADGTKAIRDDMKDRGYKWNKADRVWSRKYDAAEWKKAKEDADSYRADTSTNSGQTAPNESVSDVAPEPTKREKANARLKAKSPKDEPAIEPASQEPKPSVPARLYHGTDKSFDAFDLSHAGTNRDSGWHGTGVYLTPHPELAAKYGGHTVEADVRAESPYHWPKDAGNVRTEAQGTKELPADIRPDVMAEYAKKAPAEAEAKKGWDKVSTQGEGLHEKTLSDAVTKVLRDRGHDSVVYEHAHKEGQVEYAVLDPEKVSVAKGEEKPEPKGQLALLPAEDIKAAKTASKKAKVEWRAKFDGLLKDEAGSSTVEYAVGMGIPKILKSLLDHFRGDGHGPEDAADETPKPEVTGTLRPVEQGHLAKGELDQAKTEGRHAHNINMDYIEVNDGIKAALHTIERYNTFVKERTRGVRSHDTTERVAQLIGMSPEKLLKMRKGEALNAEQLTAARQLLMASGDNIVAMSKKIADEAHTDEDLADYLKAIVMHRAIQANVCGAIAEAGRALNAMKITVKSEAMRRRQIKEAIETFGGREDLMALAEKLKGAGEEGIAEAFNDGIIKEGLAKATSWWVNSVLSGVQTHAANALSNSLALGGKMIERRVSTVIGKALGITDAATSEEAAYESRAAWSAISEWRQILTHAIKTGESAFDSPVADNVHMGGDVAGTPAWYEWPTRFLMAEDEVFKTIHYRMETHRRAFRKALEMANEQEFDTDKQRKAFVEETARDLVYGDDETAGEIQAAAFDEAFYSTFNKRLRSGKDADGLERFGAMLTTYKGHHPAIGFVIPFVRTPVNVLKYAGERLPVAFLSKSVRAELKAGGERKAMALSKMAIGGALQATMMGLAAAGMATGGGPSDEDEKKTLMLSGWKPYSFKIPLPSALGGGNAYIGYGRLAPWAMVAGFGADVVEAIKEGRQAGAASAAKKMFAATMGNITNQTFLKGITDLAAAYHEPGRYLLNMVTSIGEGFVPYSGLQKNMKGLTDDTLRYGKPIGGKMLADFEGTSFTRPARIDAFGQDIKRGSDPVTGRLNALSPIQFSVGSGSKAAEELSRLGVDLREPKRQINGVDIPDDVYDKHARTMGKAMQYRLENLVKGSGWDRMPESHKIETLKDAIEQVHKDYNGQLRNRMGRELSQAKHAKESK